MWNLKISVSYFSVVSIVILKITCTLKFFLHYWLCWMKPLTVWITTNWGKFLKRCDYQTTLPASWEICMQVKKQQLEPNMEQWTASKLGKEYVKAVYCHTAYLTYMHSTSCEMLGWMKHKLESRLPGEISIITSDMQIIPPLWKKAKNWSSSWWKWKKRILKYFFKKCLDNTLKRRDITLPTKSV